MSIFDYKESIITKRRAGNDTDPFVPIVRNIMIKNGLVQLPEIPSEFQKVKVTGNNENWFEIVNGTPIGNQYKVSYLHGYVEFDPVHDGKILTFEFMGTGNTYISVDRVWLSYDGEKVTKTLGDLISSGESALEGLERLDAKIQETNQAINNANIATDNANQAANRVDDAIYRANQVSDTVSQEEQVRITNEGTRQINESERVTNENTRKANEQERINAEIERNNNEVDRIEAENNRITNEQTRESNEGLRVQKEQERINEENIRITNEQNRISTENTRISNEDIRKQNEQTRISNENVRQANEQDRINRYNNFVYLGEYDNTITYQPYNIISWQGSSYMCVQLSMGNLPLDNNYWKLLSRKGDKGATLTPKGVYNNTTLYEVNDLVTYDLGVYYCIQQSVGNDPTNTDYWALFLAGGGDMQREIYDTNFDGIVDNAERLGGQLPSYFAKQSDLETVQGSINNINNDISVINTNISTIDQNITTLQSDTAQLRTDVDNNKNQINTISDRVTTIESELSDQQELTTTLKYGSQVIEVPRDTPFNVLSLKGRTLVNLLGKDGNCESLTPFALNGTSPTLSTTQKRSGSNSIKCSASNQVSYVYKDYGYKLDTSKYYLIGVWVYIESWSNGEIRFTLCDKGTFTSRYSISANTGIIGQWQFIYGRIPNNNTVTTDGFRMLLGITTASIGTVYCDDAFIYEIDQATYNKINADPEYTGDKLAEKFPYVDSVQAVQNPYVIRRSRNLIPPLGLNHSNITYSSPYVFTAKATAYYVESVEKIQVLPSTDYVISVNQEVFSGGNCQITVLFYNDSTFIGEINSASIANGQIILPFTTPTTANNIQIRVARQNFSRSFEVRYTNFMLNIGSTALPFEPYQEDYLFLETKLHSSVDGTVYDELIPTDAGFEKFARFREVVLDGSLNWKFDFNGTGYRSVYISNYITSIGGIPYDWGGKQVGQLIKYNGAIGSWKSTGLADDNFNFAYGHLYITIPNSDSGWGENYTPTAQEIQAYFYGWKMNNGTFGIPYNGSGTKTWIPWSATSNADAVTTVPTTPSSDITNKVFDYYKLVYQLASPVREPVRYEGAVQLKKGQNIIELGSGVIVRERVYPALASNTRYYINNTDDASLKSANLKYNNAYILYVLKNQNKDIAWGANFKNTNSGYRVSIAQENFDPTAIYEVTYLVLDKYLFTVNPIDLSGSYEANLNEVVSKTVEKQTSIETKVSVIENTYARKKQVPWIAPTLLNGWVNYGGADQDVGYRKNEFGIVEIRGLIKDGSAVNGTTLFILPIGYRPLKNKNFSIWARDSSGTNYIPARIFIAPDGRVALMNANGYNGWVSFDGIFFDAEQ